jgi:hypothetical protein
MVQQQYYPSIFVERLRKTAIASVPALPEYKSSALALD